MIGRSRRLLCTLMLALPVLTARPASAQADTGSGPALFTYRDAVLAGSFVVGGLLVRPLDDRFADILQDSGRQSNRNLQRLATFVRTTAAPGAYVIGVTMYGAGRLSHSDRLARLGLYGTEALLVGDLSAGAIKVVVGRQRPDKHPRDSHSFGLFRGFTDDEYRSFPSGHSTAAFAAAAAVTSETSGWWPQSRWIIGPVLYSGAVLTGVSRMYNNRHWASDVIIGAGIGTFAGLKVVRWQNGHANNRVNRFFLTGSLTPTPDGGHALSFSLGPVPPQFLRP